MAQSNSNVHYLAIDGVDMSSYTTEVTITPSNALVDTTAGSATTHVERAAGLDDTSLDMSIGYEEGNLPAILAKLKVGSIFQIEYGPDGQVAGKPRHIQNFIIETSPFTVGVKKPHRVFKVAAKGSEAASSNMYAGATY